MKAVIRTWAMLLIVDAMLLAPSPLVAGVIITNFTNISLTNSQVEVGGDTSDNPNVVNGPVGALVSYTASSTAGSLASPYNLPNLNDGDIGMGILSDGTYGIPFNGTLTLAFSQATTIRSIAIYNGYTNRDDGSYLLQDAANNLLGAYTISGTTGFTNAGADSFWLTFTTPVTTTALQLSFNVSNADNQTASFREIQVFGPETAVPEPASSVLALCGIFCSVGGWVARRRNQKS